MFNASTPRPQERGRFGRQPAPTRRSVAVTRRSLAPTPGRFGRRPQKKSNSARALEGLAGLLPGSGRRTKPRRRGHKGKAGIALLAGAAGLAFKNREKLTSVLTRKEGRDQQPLDPPPAGEIPPSASSSEAELAGERPPLDPH